ncbi:MFS transporter, partial [Mammaliicoccus lentus]|uniref:MFS transporter n=1 Tax=Mammaliicoccus lentus TaxID=42858 RepID=UPI003558EA8E
MPLANLTDTNILTWLGSRAVNKDCVSRFTLFKLYTSHYFFPPFLFNLSKGTRILYAGRIVAGITGATGAVAGAYIADITDGEDRARHFGLMSACFGVGMVAGPVAGGLLGAISLHAPFLAAAVLNGLNLLLGCF